MCKTQSGLADGFSLLELLLVLSVVAAIMLAAVSHFHYMQQERQLKALSQNVAMLKQAALTYYQRFCRTDDPIPMQQLNRTTLQHKQLWPQLQPVTYVTHPEYDYSVGATLLSSTQTKTNKPVYQLNVFVNMHVPKNTLPWYKNKIAGASIAEDEDSSLQWQFIPGADKTITQSSLWLMKTGLSMFKRSAVLDHQAVLSTDKDFTCAN